MNRLPFLGLLFALLCLVACRQMNEAHLLHLAEKQVNMNVDSVYALLVQIERPSQLSDEERLLYGWLNAYVHYKRHNSMAEDSFILPASVPPSESSWLAKASPSTRPYAGQYSATQ